MDPRIWSRLPDHLLERVLSFLPLKNFISLRSTCKHFNSLLFTPLFISKHNSLSSFILLSHPHFHNKFPLFNTLINSWHTTPLSFPPSLSSQPSVLLSSSNGLLCFSLPRSSCFVICNLLTRSFRRVEFPKRPFNFELPTLVPTGNGCILFMLSSKNAILYDTASDSWKQYPGFDPLLNGNFHQKGVYFNGTLVFTTPEPFHLVSFRLDTGKWEGPTTALPYGLTFVRLVNDGDGKLYLIGGVGISGISRSLKIWEMEEEGGKWEELERMPEMVCRKFVSICYHNYEHVYCFWHEGLICVCCYTWPQVLYYKVERRTWHWLPVCPSLLHKWSCGFRWFSFKPEVYANV